MRPDSRPSANARSPTSQSRSASSRASAGDAGRPASRIDANAEIESRRRVMMTAHGSTPVVRSQRGSVRVRSRSHPHPDPARPRPPWPSTCVRSSSATTGPLPTRTERYRVGELIAHCQTQAPALEAAVWEVALDHERRGHGGRRARARRARRASWARVAAASRPRSGPTTPASSPCRRSPGWVWPTSSTWSSPATTCARSKPDPDGWRVIAEHFGKLANGAGDPRDAVVVATRGSTASPRPRQACPFIAYRARQEDLDRWQVTPIVHLADLALLPAWLAAQRNGRP